MRKTQWVYAMLPGSLPKVIQMRHEVPPNDNTFASYVLENSFRDFIELANSLGAVGYWRSNE